MAEQVNAGYKIISHIVVDELEFVLGFNPKAAQQYVTWEYTSRSGYFWGHYFGDYYDALEDLLQRAGREIEARASRHRGERE